MMRAACAHCAAPYSRDVDDEGPDAYLCPDCADLAVMGAPCADCGETPGRRPCRDVDSLRHYRALELERRAH